MIRRPLSPPTTTRSSSSSLLTPAKSAAVAIIERFKADPANIQLLEELLKTSRLENFRWEMNQSDCFMYLARELIHDVEKYDYQNNRESLQRREYLLKALTNSCFQNERVKEALLSNHQFLTILCGLMQTSFDLIGDVCDLIKNLVFNINPHFHDTVSHFVPRICYALEQISVRQQQNPAQCERFAKNALRALWNLVAQSKHNQNAICQNPLAFRVVVWHIGNGCYEEVFSVLRCIRETMFLHYEQLQAIMNETHIVDWLISLLMSPNSINVENALLLLKDFCSNEPLLVDFLRHARQDVVRLLQEVLINSWITKISLTARFILEEQIGLDNNAFMEEEAETVYTQDCIDEDDFPLDLHPPLPDPLTPANQYHYPNASYDLADLPLLEEKEEESPKKDDTPKRKK